MAASYAFPLKALSAALLSGLLGGLLALSPALAAERGPVWAARSEAVSLNYAAPPAAARSPALALALMERFLKDADAARAEAERDRKTRAAQGPGAFRPHRFARTETSLSVSTEGGERALISVLSETFIDFGGAHPITKLDALLWDAKGRRALDWPALFGAKTPPGPIRAAWRKAASALRFERGLWEAGPLDAAEARLAETPVTLAPSTVPGKAGGVVFQHEAYALGPYYHGPYRVVLPYDEIADLLSPEYAPYFAGAPDLEALGASD